MPISEDISKGEDAMISFLTILLRLSVALVLGSLVGLERESHDHEAGMRTNALVAVGTALFTIISAYGFLGFLGLTHIQIDPTRIASYVVAGIGFLGGGVIFLRHESERVKGVTTAAAIWVVAAIGMACGAGLLWEAVTVAALALIILVGFRYIEKLLLPRHKSDAYHIHIETTAVDAQFIGQVYEICQRNNIPIDVLDIRKDKDIDYVKITSRTLNVATLASALAELRALEGVQAVNADVPEPGKE
jgi:putative Mg2+ transporter-C (MgtC) family protein